MQRSGFLPMGIGLIILALGMLLLQGSLIAIAIPLILYSCLRAILLLVMRTPTLVVHRALNKHRIVEGDELEVRLEIALQKGSPRSYLSVIDQLPPKATLVDGESQYLGLLLPLATQTLSYRILLPRGQHEFPGIQVAVWSRWGIASKTEMIDEPTDVIVHPSTVRLNSIPIRPRRTRGFAGTVRANLGGQGLSFFGCRSYVPGDDVRRVNWRAYARQNTLIINEYELERIADVSIVLDARLRAHWRLDADTTFDHCVRAAGSLSDLFLGQGNIVGLLVYGDFLHWVFPGVGRTQQQRILDSLATAYAAEKAVFEDLRNLPTRLFPAQSQIVLISPLAEQEDVEVVSLLIDRGYSVILVCPHAASWEAEQAGDSPSATLARDAIRLQRSLFLDSLIRTGTRVVNWDVSEPLVHALKRDVGQAFVRRH